jgi:hypothetical protein
LRTAKAREASALAYEQGHKSALETKVARLILMASRRRPKTAAEFKSIAQKFQDFMIGRQAW